jgi:hypothetical protein
VSVSVLYTFLFRFLDVKCNIDELYMHVCLCKRPQIPLDSAKHSS